MEDKPVITNLEKKIKKGLRFATCPKCGNTIGRNFLVRIENCGRCHYQYVKPKETEIVKVNDGREETIVK